MIEKYLGEPEVEPRKEWGFSELQQRVRVIYEKHDLECGYGAATILAKTLGNAATLKQVIRKTPDDFNSIDRSLTNVFIWTSTFANVAKMDLQEILEGKFGSGCPHCKQMPCLLAKGEKCEKPQDWKPLPSKNPRTLTQWQNHLEAMYPNNFKGDLGEALKKTSGRITDEIGELIVSSYRDIEEEIKTVSFQEGTNPWESEIADALAWSFALANCLKKIRATYSIENSLKEKYKEGCSYCKSPECICPKAKTFIDEAKK